MSMRGLSKDLFNLGISVTKLQAQAKTSTAANIPTATTTVAGTVLKGAAVPAAAGANPTKAEYDAMLVVLRNAGVIT